MVLSKAAELPQWFTKHIRVIAALEEQHLRSNPDLQRCRNELQVQRAMREVNMCWPFVKSAAVTERSLSGVLPLAWDEPELPEDADDEAAYMLGQALALSLVSNVACN